VQQALVTRLMCYTDNPAFTVNPPAIAAPNTGADTCPPAPAAECGDGLPGSPPPLVYGDIDLAHTQLSGVGTNYYDTTTNTIHIEGCFQGVDNDVVGGPQHIVYTRAVIDAHTGQGTVDIWLARPDCLNPDPTLPTFDDKPIETAENYPTKGTNGLPETGAQCAGNTDSDGDGVADDGCPENHYDTDLDGCTDTQELRDTQGTGGLRDPYNRWDFEDQFTGAPPAKDRTVAVGDIGAVVARFGSAGSPAGDPNASPPAAPAYHTSADRNGSLPGSNAWNLKPPNGSVTVGDIGTVVSQFGQGCTS
jgi:hypothetical protein